MVDYMLCKNLGSYWVPANKDRRVGKERRTFFLINSARAVREAEAITRASPRRVFNFMFTNQFRPTKRNIMELFHRIPNLGKLACSGYTWRARLSRVWRPAIERLLLPVGATRRWTRNVCAVVKRWLSRGDSLGSVCKQLNVFGIKISVRGLMRHHWHQVKPPPRR